MYNKMHFNNRMEKKINLDLLQPSGKYESCSKVKILIADYILDANP